MENDPYLRYDKTEVEKITETNGLKDTVYALAYDWLIMYNMLTDEQREEITEV